MTMPADYAPELHGKAARILESIRGTDEPVFIFRAKDLLSTMVLIHYQELVAKFDCGDVAFEAEIVDSIQAWRQWQKDHPELVRLPD